MIKLLSLDSSTSATGYSVFVDGKYKYSGCIDLHESGKSSDRLSLMIKELYSLIDEEKPDIIVAEEMVVTRNAQAARMLTMILGAVYGKCLKDEIFWFVLRPTEWRSLVKEKDEKLPRKRDALKEWSKNKVSTLYGVEDVSDDISDSILIGEAYCRKFQ